jgi:indole-3-glycerol phosphate synthase
MKFSFASHVLAASAASILLVNKSANAFAPSQPSFARAGAVTSERVASSTSLNAWGALTKKAKKDDLRKYVESGIDDAVMEKYKIIKEKAAGIDLSNQTPGPLQEALTRRKGTLTVIAEYKRKIQSGYVNEIFDPEVLSPSFREFGASGIAVMADERMGGCSYADLAKFVEEQRRAVNEVPGPVMIINNDLVIDELQIARTAAIGASACVITLSIVGEEDLPGLLKATKALDLEPIVAVSSHEEAQRAIDLGARMISVIHVTGVDDKVAVVQGLVIPEGQTVCTIANILARHDNKQLQEIEEAWAVRDKGFNCAWVGEALYKSGSDQSEHPGAIIRSMKSKSSLKWASPKASSGRGEGAREYLGDILM